MLILSCKLVEITGQHKPCVCVCVDDDDDYDSMDQKAFHLGTCAGSLRTRVCWSTFLRTAWTSFCSEPTQMLTSSSPTGSLSTWYVTSCHCVTLVTVVWGIGFIVGLVMLLFLLLLLLFFSSVKRQQLYFNVLSTAHGYIRITHSRCGDSIYIYIYKVEPTHPIANEKPPFLKVFSSAHCFPNTVQV